MKSLQIAGLLVIGLIACPTFAANVLDAGYQIGKKIPLPSTFTDDMRQGVQLSLDDLGCSWAVREKIYAFNDVIIFATEGSDDYFSYKPATVLANGCWLPPHITAQAGYIGLLPVSPGRKPVFDILYGTGSIVTAGLVAPTPGNPLVNQIAPENFRLVIKEAMQVSQRQLACRWASKPFIYVFSDGIVFTDSNAKTYNVYHYDDANAMATNCMMPSAVSVEDMGDIHSFAAGSMISYFGETQAEEGLSKYIETQNTQRQCLGRWRWTESWTEGNFTVQSCLYRPDSHIVLKKDLPGAFLPGVKKVLVNTEIVVNLGEMQATKGTTKPSEANSHAQGNFLIACRKHEAEWLKNFRAKRTVDNGSFVLSSPALMSDPRYARLFEELPLPKALVITRNAFKNKSNAACQKQILGACVEYKVTSQCEIRYKLEKYVVYTKKEELPPVKLDPSCEENKLLSSPVAKTAAGYSKLGILENDLSLDESIESTSGHERSAPVCTSGVHEKDSEAKYKYLNQYIQSRMETPGIENDSEFTAAVATLWALFIEKSDEMIPYLENIETIHRRFPKAVFMGHSDEDLGINL